MHPFVVSEQSTSCPICGMPLARRERGATATLPEGGLARVRLAPWRIAQAGIRTVEVGLAPATEELTTVGFVGFDESRHVLVASGTRGRRGSIGSMSPPWACASGRASGSPSCTVLTSHNRSGPTAKRHRAGTSRPAAPPDPQRTPLGDPEERVRLATQGLKVLGVRQDQIDSIAAHDDPDELLPLLAPISGHVIKKDVYEGQYVSRGRSSSRSPI